MQRDRAQKERIIDLEDEHGEETTLLVRYRGVLTPLTKARILQMMRREEAFLAGTGTTRPASAAPKTVPVPARKAPAASEARDEVPILRPTGSISHAGLSVRIKRMYQYNLGGRELRAAHAEHLPEILACFDWIIPEHPNSLLDFHLREIAAWKGVATKLKGQIDAFLKRYQEARYRRVD